MFVPFLTVEAFSEAGLLDTVVPVQMPPLGPGLSILQPPGMEASGSSWPSPLWKLPSASFLLFLRLGALPEAALLS